MITIALALAGCNGDTGTKLVSDLTAEPGVIAGTVWVSWTSPESGTGTVNFGLDTPEENVGPTSKSGTDHRVLLLEPQVGRVYKIQVDYETDGGDTGSSEEVEVTVEPPGQGTPQFTQGVYDPAASCMEGGYFLFSWLGDGQSGVGILDREGKYVWAVKNEVDDTLIARARPGRDGTSVLYNFADAQRGKDVAEVVRVSMDGEATTHTRTVQGHHDFIELPDGRIAWLGFEFNDADIIGDDPDLGVVSVATDTIMVDDEGVSDTASAQTLFSFVDTYGTDVYDLSNRPNTDTKFLSQIADYEYSHSNSLVYNESDDAFMMMFRWLDTMAKLDAQSGDLQWTWGNLPGIVGDFTPAPPTEDTDRFIHGHFSEAWGDQVLVFDNHDPDDSFLKRFTIDESANTFSLDWQFDSDRLETLLGDVRRMPIEGCDNLLVSFSAQSRLVEMTPEGEIVWEVAGGLGAVTSRVQFIPDLYDFSSVAYPQ